MRLSRRYKKVIILGSIFLFVFLGVNLLKTFFLNQIKSKIESNFSLESLHFSFFPPSLVVEDIQSLSEEPFFSARKIIFRIAASSIFRKERPLEVIISHPVLNIQQLQRGGIEEKPTEITRILPAALEKALIRKGELHYIGKAGEGRITELDALFQQKKGRFIIKAVSPSSLVTLEGNSRSLQGKLSLAAEGDEKEVFLQRLNFSGKDGYLRTKGRIKDFLLSSLELEGSLELPVDFIGNFFDFPFPEQGRLQAIGNLRKQENRIAFSSEFLSDNLVFQSLPLGEVKGKIKSLSNNDIELELNLRKKGKTKEYLQCRFSQGRIEGQMRGLYLDPVIEFIDIPWPVSSPVWGSFSYSEAKLWAKGEFRDQLEVISPELFPFQGVVEIELTDTGHFSFRSDELETSFAKVSLEGNMSLGVEVDARIKGEVTDIQQARRFTSLFLQKEFVFPEIGGKGKADIRIFGKAKLPQVFLAFSASPAIFADFEALSVNGEAEVIQNDFFGRFDVKDPNFQGKIGVVANRDQVTVDLRLQEGLVERILPPLKILLPLEGKASGDFSYRLIEDSEEFQGEFRSQRLLFSGQDLLDVTGRMRWQDDTIHLSEVCFYLYEGLVEGEASISQLKEEFDVDISGQELDFSALAKGASGFLSFSLKGKGSFNEDKANGSFEANNLVIYPFQKTRAEGNLEMGFSIEGISLEVKGNFLPGENSFSSAIHIPFGDLPLTGDLEGKFTNLDLLLPWSGGKGEINYLAQLNGSKTQPEIKGAIDFKGNTLPFARFAHALRNFSGLVFFKNEKFTLRSLQGTLGDGPVQGSGWMVLGKSGPEEINVSIKGSGLSLSPWERTHALTDAELSLIKDADRFVLEGDIHAHRLLWRRELTEKLEFYSEPYYISERKTNLFDDLNLNLHIKVDNNAWMENSLGRLQARVDLNIIGNVQSPILLGEIEVLEGEVYFQDREFKILKGRVGFFNPTVIEPYLSFEGETYVKDYRVTFALEGLIDSLTPEFSSSPPLPPEDVLALLALGEAFTKTYSYDRSTQLSTTSFLSFQLSEEAKKRAEKLFNIDRFRIDPFILGSSAEMTARLTVGKKISRNFTLLYSTNLTAQREEIARLEWELMEDLSIVGMRDENGRVSIDVKVHKRF
ncbi:MAG: translocation/assembly module TamB domain-containing protein [Acidobacteriota bacterium]